MDSSQKNFNVDKLTLQFFTNKHTYKKYLAKQDPDTYEQKQMDFDHWREHGTEIHEIVQEGLDSPDDIMPKSLRDAFHHFVKEAMLFNRKTTKYQRRKRNPSEKYCRR